MPGGLDVADGDFTTLIFILLCVRVRVCVFKPKRDLREILGGTKMGG